MAVDPRFNCAAEICCPPLPALTEGGERPYNQDAHRSRVGILIDLGVPDELAHRVSKSMAAAGVCFLSTELATAIRNIAFPEGG